MGPRDWPPHRDVVKARTDHGSLCLWNSGGHLPSKAGPACLPAHLPPEALGEMEARCKPCLDWHILVANNPQRQLGPACPTRRHLGPFTITPCSQTGKQCPGHVVLKLLPPTPTSPIAVFNQLPKLSCPGATWTGPPRPLCLLVCVCGSTHIPRRRTPPPSSTAGVAIGETRILPLWEAPYENCGNASSEPWVQT